MAESTHACSPIDPASLLERVVYRQSAIERLAPNGHSLKLRHLDQARADFAVIGHELDFMKTQLARVLLQE